MRSHLICGQTSGCMPRRMALARSARRASAASTLTDGSSIPDRLTPAPPAVPGRPTTHHCAALPDTSLVNASGRRGPCWPPAVASLAPVTRASQSATGQLAGDDQALDLGSAFPDLIDLGVAVPLLDGEVADIAVATQDLDGVFGDPH